MRHIQNYPYRSATKELLTFLSVLAICLGLTIFLGVNAPPDKGPRVYLAHGIFSALFAVPTGAAWRSLRQAVRSRRRLAR
jgi:hypothetical protein